MIRRRTAMWVVLTGSAIVFVACTAWLAHHASSRTAAAAIVTQGLGLMTIAAVGVLLRLRRPDNVIGQIFLIVWLLACLTAAVTTYAQWATLQSPDAWGASVATWINNWDWVPLIGLIAFYPALLFPTGRPLSPRWSWLTWCMGVVLVLWTVAFALQPSQYSDAFGQQVATGNPYASPVAAGVVDTLPSVLSIAFIALVVTALVSLVLRYRSGDGQTRAQLKWVVLGASLWLPLLLYPGEHGGGQPIDIYTGVALAGVPVAMTVAILRYRLYDIDRIISRTIAYLIVSVAVAVTFAVIVLSASRLMGRQSPLVVAAATLLAAALARPLLARVQAAVDRRFNRARYDAAHTVDTFGSRLRNEVDVDAVALDLRGAVAGTLEPATIQIWLAPR
jgi:hypothetical protein